MAIKGITPGLGKVIGKATAEFAVSLVTLVIARINGQDIPDDALEKNIRGTLKQATAYELAREIRAAQDQ